jgi:hypothetical protein
VRTAWRIAPPRRDPGRRAARRERRADRVGARLLLECALNFVRDVVEQALVRADEHRGGVGIVLGLRQQLGGEQGRVRGVIRDDQHLGWTGR